MMKDSNPILQNYYYVASALKDKQTLQLLNQLANYDTETFNHSLRVALKSIDIGCKLQLTEDDRTLLTKAALLHDIGKIFVPISIINKPEPLTSSEYAIIKTHTSLGAEHVLKTLPNETRLAKIICEHHENFDGSGYPNQVHHLAIDKLARIIRIADTYDAMSNDRPYQRMVPNHIIHELFFTDFGHCYDPNILTVL